MAIFYCLHSSTPFTMDLLPDTQNCGLRMRRECRERFRRHRLQMKPLVSDPSMHHGTCVTHVPWCMSGSLTRGVRKNVPGIPGECVTHNFALIARGPWRRISETNINVRAGMRNYIQLKGRCNNFSGFKHKLCWQIRLTCPFMLKCVSPHTPMTTLSV